MMPLLSRPFVALPRALAPLFLLAPGIHGQLVRPPQPPPGYEEAEYVEHLLERYQELLPAGRFTEVQRARAKVFYYLSWRRIDERIGQLDAQIEREHAEIERLRQDGQSRRAEPRLAGLEALREQRARLVRLREGSGTEEDLGKERSALTIATAFDPLRRQPDGRLRPQRVPQPSVFDVQGYFTVWSASPQGPVPANQRGLLDVEGLLSAVTRQGIRLEAGEREFLFELAEEAGRCIEALGAGRGDELGEVFDRRWAWVMEWGPTLEEWRSSGHGSAVGHAAVAAAAPANGGLLRPPAAPPRAADARAVHHVLDRYRVLKVEEPHSLTCLKARALAAWYSDCARVHFELQGLRRDLESTLRELEAERELGRAKAEEEHRRTAERLRARMALLQDWLEGRAAAPRTDGRGFDQAPGEPDGWEFDGETWRPTQEAEGAPLLGVFALRADASSAAPCRVWLESLQQYLADLLPRARADEDGRIRELIEDLERGLRALERGEYDEVRGILDKGWAWVLADLDFDELDQRAPAALEPLVVLLADGPPPPFDPPAIKGQRAVTRNRQQIQAKVHRALTLARQQQPEGPLPFARVRAGLPGAWGIGWADLRAGGDTLKVRSDLEQVGKDLRTWSSRAKQDSSADLEAARSLAGRVAATGKRFEEGDLGAVMEDLAALRAWILEDSGLPLH